jgi:membrane protein insertase Oxa1/YidC/SpoIIIJ
MIRKLLETLLIIQVLDNEERYNKGLERLGQGYFKAYRINPYNPLSYLFLAIIIPIGILLFGVIGFPKEVVTKNPFKWD